MTKILNKKYSILFIVNLLIVLNVDILQAQKYAADFLNIGVGARALGMGSAYVAISNDATAAYWNPAGLSQLHKREITIMHANRFSGLVQTNFINLAIIDKHGNAFALSYFRVGIDDIPKSTKLDEFDRPIIEKYIQDVEQALFLSFARKNSNNFSLGGNLKAIFQKVGDHSSLGLGFDIGALYCLSPHLSFGVSLQDLAGTYIFWDTGHRDVKYPTIVWGLAFSHNVPILSGKTTLAINNNIRFEGQNNENLFSLGEIAGYDVNLGGEYVLLNTIAFRVGMERKNLTAGAGLRLRFFEIDYAFVSYDLGNTHRISGKILF